MIFDNLWDALLIFFWGFAVVAYLIALFAVIFDLFRDRELSGGAKAVWIIFLVFLPFLTVLVYLIARGSGMALRSQQQAQQARAETDEYIRTIAGSSPADEIAKAKSLLDAGTITQPEYEALKAKALA